MMRNGCAEPAVSVIIPVLNEGAYLERTIDQLAMTAPPCTEVIVVDDGATDGCCDFLRNAATGIRLLEPERERLGVSGARNRGAACAVGEVLIFLDAHMLVPPGWIERLRAAVLEPGVAAVGPGISVLGRPECCGWGMRYQDAGLGIQWLGAPASGAAVTVPLLAGACITIRRNVFDDLGGFDSGMRRWGSEDAELSLHLWMAGYEARVVPDVVVGHLFREKHPYAIDWETILYNQLRLSFVHFDSARVTRVIDRLKRFGNFSAACAMLAESDVHERRAAVRARRVFNDDRYFETFGDIY